MIKFVPKWYQELGIELFVSHSYAGLFWPPGLGKTAVALFAFQILREKGFVDRMFVTSTKKVVTNTWPREIQKWTPWLSHSVARGKLSKRMEALEAEADVTLLNMENLAWYVDLTLGAQRRERYQKRNGKYGKRWVLDEPERPDLLLPRSMLVIDESSKWRNHNALRFRVMRGEHKRDGLLEYFDRRYILTGSPAPRSLLNLWAQLYCVDLGESLGTHVTHYRAAYFYPSGYLGKEYELKDGAAKKIYEKIGGRILRVGEGALKMPGLHPVMRVVDMDDEARVVYRQMEKEALIELEGEKIDAKNAGIKTQKLRQLANGFIYHTIDDPKSKRKKKVRRKSYQLHDVKAQECLDLVEETQGTPALIGYVYDEDLKALQEAFGDDAVYVTAKTKDAEFDEIESAWNAGEIDVLIGQISILAYGLNLQETHASVIYYTVPWDLEDYEQFYRRVWRQGQKNAVFLYHILCRDSVDDIVVMPSIEKKDRRQQTLLDNLEKFMARRRKFVRAKSLIRVGEKEGMELIVDTIAGAGQDVPRLRHDVDDPGGVLLSLIHKRMKSWTPTIRREFISAAQKKETEEDSLETCKKIAEQILCADVEQPIAPDTYKMWPKQSKPKGGKKMATSKASKFSKKKVSKKKASKKKASKKKASKKKASKKKVSKKKVSKKKSVSKSADLTGKSYVAVEDAKIPRIEVRQKIVAKVKKAKGRGIAGNTLLEYVTSTLGLSDKRALTHVLGCVKMGFIEEK